MMNRQFLPQIGIYYFLKGAEYDPKVIRDAAKKESAKFFVPSRWPVQVQSQHRKDKFSNAIDKPLSLGFL